ncbi:MAG: DUF4091 domain-containing protein [Bacteroidales bacterium]
MKTIKLIAGFFLLFLVGFTFPAEKDFKISIFDELSPIYPDSRIDKQVTSYTVDVCKGSIAAIHILMTDLIPMEPVRFALTAKGLLDKFYANWYFMIDVPVTENTGLEGWTEKSNGQPNPYVIRKAPFRIFEAFDPVQTGYIPITSTQALRMEIPIGKDFPTGKQLFTIHISSKGQVKKLELTVNVYPVEIPPVNQAHLNYVNWLNIGNICKDHEVELWSEPFWGMLRKYAQMMAKGRQNTFWFIWSDFFRFNPDGTVAEFYDQKLERYINTFLLEGLTTIQGAPFARRRDWSSDAFLVAVPTSDNHEIPAVSEEGRKIIRSMARPIIDLMNKKEWEERWYQGIFDEPTDEYVDRYKATADFLRTMKPDLRILEATMTVSLAGTVNCWCPQVQEFQKNISFFEQRQAAGDAVWVYTCLMPGGPWINRLIDQERLRQVYVGWACAKYDLQGFLHWGFNMHSGKPYEELVRMHGGPNNFLPAGDSHIVYPGKKGPLSSQRFEAHRIGMEDYELLYLLKKQQPELANQLINKLFQAFDQYDKDIRDYRSVKKEVLGALYGRTI